MKRLFVLFVAMILICVPVFAGLFTKYTNVEFCVSEKKSFVSVWGSYEYDGDFQIEINNDYIELVNFKNAVERTVFFNEKVDVWIDVWNYQVRLVGTSTDRGSVVIDGKAGKDFVEKLLAMIPEAEAKEYNNLVIRVLARGTGDERHIEYQRQLRVPINEFIDNMAKLFPDRNLTQ